MNTFLNLLSASAVILTGAFASSPFEAVPGHQSSQLAVAAETQQGHDEVQSSADPQWLTISDVRGPIASEQSFDPQPGQRWVF